MKVLLLSCNTGEGHHSAALAVQDALNERGIPNVLADPLSFAGKHTRKRAADLYNSIIRNTPRTFGLIYRVGELADSNLPYSPIYFANSLYAAKMQSYIADNGFDAVVSTHLYGMEALTAIRQKLGGTVPSYGVLTDYTCIPFFSDCKLDGYFIPHRDLTPELTAHGLDERRFYPTGIPVATRFASRLSKEQARRRLGLPLDRRLYLVMTGGVGCGRISQLCDGLLAQETEPFLACVLAGKNQRLRQSLQERYGADGQVQAMPFTREVNLYMNAADVLITKPGGLSSTEAAAARVPLVHVITIPGCEEKNAAFFAAHGMSQFTKSMEEAARLAVSLGHSPDACAAQCRRQAEEINANAARAIVDILCRGYPPARQIVS